MGDKLLRALGITHFETQVEMFESCRPDQLKNEHPVIFGRVFIVVFSHRVRDNNTECSFM